MRRGAFILGCAGPDLLSAERRFFARANPWGFILFARNVQTPEQLTQLTTDLRDAVGWNAPILVDQEGGRVERLGPPHWRHWPAPLDQMQVAPDARAMELRYRIIAAELRAVGIDANCAPVADIARPQTHAVLKNRCYGTDAAGVTKAARAVATGLLAGGVLPVVKHMPGHGLSHLDTHLALPRVDQPEAWLDSRDFAPFRALADLPMAMTAHLVFSAIDPDHPATQSPVMINLIRRDIGFDGLLMSDDISMEALSGPVGERGAAALKAGCDLILHCNGDLPQMEDIAALGQMTPSAQIRADRALGWRKTPDAVDIRALEAEFLRLVPEVTHG